MFSNPEPPSGSGNDNDKMREEMKNATGVAKLDTLTVITLLFSLKMKKKIKEY